MPRRLRRVLALDYRGRGLSGYDPDPGPYTVAIELADVLAVAHGACRRRPAIFIGTSRGGIITMPLAAVPPGRNRRRGAQRYRPGDRAARADAHQGLCRQAAAAGDFARKAPRFCAALVRRQFPKLGPADWLALANRGWRERNGALVTTYDPAIMNTLAAVTPDSALPAMWAHSMRCETCRSLPSGVPIRTC